jgi:hypothetical protein
MKSYQRWILLSLLTLVCASCTTKQKLLNKSLMASDSTQLKQFFKHQEKSILLSDSSQRNYEIEVWPKGLFTFGDAGFTGEAYRLKVKGSTTQLRALHEQDQQVVGANERTELKQRAKHKTAEHKLKRSVWWPYVCVLLMIGAIYWLIRKIKT